MSRVNVVIPVYNAEAYLNKCVESILQQTYQDFELILVDDGSDDNSGEICDQYAERYEHISVIHTKNMGPAAARRTGVNAAEGEYIVFVDADDWLDENMLAFSVRECEENRAEMVCLGHKEVDGQGRIRSCSAQDTERLEMDTTIEMMYHLHGTRLIDSGPWAKLIARCLFEGIDYCENVTIGEDYFMILQLLERADKVIFCREALYERCIRTTSISRSGYTARHKQAFEQYMYWRIYLLERYPELQVEITGYHIEYEMAVITAMCRNKRYDKIVIRNLVKDLRKNQKIILHSKETPLYMKISAVIIAYYYPLFIFIFRVIHLLTGR